MPIIYSGTVSRPLTCFEFDNNFREALKRENHTGTQLASSISDLESAISQFNTIINLQTCCTTLTNQLNTLRDDLFGAGQLSSIIADIRAQLDAILEDIDAYLGTSNVILDLRNSISPVGVILPYGGVNPPNSKWMLAHGQAISRIAYPTLFSVFGTRYGIGDGVNTFNLPDLRDQFVVGSGSNYDVGDVGGEATHVLTQAEMPIHSHDHTHTLLALQDSGNATDQFGLVSGDVQGYYSYKQTNDQGSNLINSDVIDVGTVGGNVAHNNLPPYTALTYIVKVL